MLKGANDIVTHKSFVSDIAIFVLKRDVKLQLTNTQVTISSRRWMWSTLPPTVRSLWHSPAN